MTSRAPLFLLFTMAAVAECGDGIRGPVAGGDADHFCNDRSHFRYWRRARPRLCDRNPDGIPVLIHGASGSLHVWEAARAKHQARLILAILPGHGLAIAGRGDYTVEAYVDFIEMLVDTLKLDRFVLVGFDRWCVACSLRQAAHQGEPVILVNSAGYLSGGQGSMADPLVRLALIGEIASY